MILPDPVVVKIGGSLYDWPLLGPRLEQLLHSLPPRTLLIPGGGQFVDVVRHLDVIHRLGEEASHWLALQSLGVAARFLAAIISGSEIQIDRHGWEAAWSRGRFPILDPLPFAVADEAARESLPHHWEVTSDSLANRIASCSGARSLLLVKSCAMKGESLGEAVAAGIIDPFFSRMPRENHRVFVMDLRGGGEPQELR